VTTNDESQAGETGGPARMVQPRLVRRLSAETRGKLFRGALESRLAPGEVLNHPQRTPTIVGLVLEGLLRNYVVGPRDREQSAGYLGEGDLVGASHLLGGTAAVGTQALTVVRFVRLSTDAVRQLMATDPTLALAIGAELARDHRAATEELAETAFRKIRDRVAHHLLMRAEMQGEVLSITHRDLAVCVGSVREVVGRSLHDLEAADAVRRTEDGQLVVDRSRLRAVVGEFTTGGH
jgi:CRP-like cAMP-binding protein